MTEPDGRHADQRPGPQGDRSSSTGYRRRRPRAQVAPAATPARPGVRRRPHPAGASRIVVGGASVAATLLLMSAMARSEGGVPQVAAGSTAPAASLSPAERFAAPLPAGPAVQPTDAAPVAVSDAS